MLEKPTIDDLAKDHVLSEERFEFVQTYFSLICRICNLLPSSVAQLAKNPKFRKDLLRLKEIFLSNMHSVDAGHPLKPDESTHHL